MFDLEAYKVQCREIATAYRNLLKEIIDVDAYLVILADNVLVPEKAVAKIEREVVLKGPAFRPIDAYKF